MKFIHSLFLCGTLALLGTGCVSYYTEAGAHANVEPSPQDGPGYNTQFAVSDQKVKAEGAAKVWFWLFTTGEPKFAAIETKDHFFGPLSPTRVAVNKAKAAATYAAVDKAQADCLFGTIYRFKVTDYFFVSTIECEATGFPGTMTGIEFIKNRAILLDENQKLLKIPSDTRLENYSNPAALPAARNGLLGWLF